MVLQCFQQVPVLISKQSQNIMISFSSVSPTALYEFLTRSRTVLKRFPQPARQFSGLSQILLFWFPSPSPRSLNQFSDRSWKNCTLSRFDLNQFPPGSAFILVPIPFSSHILPATAQTRTFWEPAENGCVSIVQAILPQQESMSKPIHIILAFRAAEILMSRCACLVPPRKLEPLRRMAKSGKSKADRRSKRAQQERLDALTEGGVVCRLEPGQMRSDFADPAGSETSEEVKARAARTRKARKALSKRMRRVLASKAAEALELRPESVPDLVQAAAAQQIPDEPQVDQQPAQQKAETAQQAAEEADMPQAEEVDNPSQPDRRSQEETIAEQAAKIDSLFEQVQKLESKAAAASKVKPSYSQVVSDTVESQPSGSSGSMPPRFAAQPATTPQAEALGDIFAPALSKLNDFDLGTVDRSEQDALLTLFADQQAAKRKRASDQQTSKQQAKKADRQRRRAKLQKELQELDSSPDSSDNNSSADNDDWETVDTNRGKKSRTLGHGSKPDAEVGLDAEARLKQKRSLAKLAMQVVDHLPCKFVDWKKGPARWLLTVESAAYAVELPFEYLINRLGKAIGADSAKMAEWISDHTLEGRALSCTWQDYKSAFVQYFPALPTCVNRDTWAALTMENCGGFHKYVQTFQQQAAEVCPSEAEKIHAFKRGLSSALQNAGLLDTSTKEPWTEFAPLLKVATSFANAMLAPNRRSHGSGTADVAGRSSTGQKSADKGKRKSSSSPDQKAASGSGSNPADFEAAKARFMAKAQTTWCRRTSRCDDCLQVGHQKAACKGAAKPEDQEALSEFRQWRKDNNIVSTLR